MIPLLALAVSASRAHAAPAEFAGSSSDGAKVFFTTTAKLVPGDTDNGFRDVYERFYDPTPGIESYVTREISTGPTGGNDSYDATFEGVSSDGTKAFFSTAESLVSTDTDRSTDIYMRNTTTGETTLVSQGAAACAPTCGNGAFPATYVGSTPSGSKVFFTTSEQLAEGDAGEARDVYVRNLNAVPATTTLVSRPDSTCTGCAAAAPVTFQAASSDGTKVVFESTDKLAEADGDTETDVYERDLTGGTTKLVSVPGTCPPPLTVSECAPLYRGTSSDGARVFLQTKARLTGADQDNAQDVYEWSAATGTVSMVSTSAEAEEGPNDAIYAGVSPDGSEVFFETPEKLSSADGDTASDVYARSAAATSLVSPGTENLPAGFNQVSADGSTVLFSTPESLNVEDEGQKQDVYASDGGATTLVSAGSPEFDSTFVGASSDASKVFYTTAAKLSVADTDSSPDVYEWAGAVPTLISTGPINGNGATTPHLSAVSSDGSRALFTTPERLTVDDNFAGEQDVYERAAAGTLLVSTGNSGELQLGPPSPGLTGTSPSSPNTSLEPEILGEAEAGALIKVYTSADCSGAPAGTGTAVASGSPGAGSFAVRVSVAAGSTSTFRATATNTSFDTSACSAGAVTYKQEAAPPPPSEEGSGGGTIGGGGSGGTTGGSGGSSGDGSGASGGSIEIGGITYVAPRTRITFGPAAKTRVRRPVFRFLDATGQPGTKFACKVDRHPWKACASPFHASRLNPGRHVFSVKGKSVARQWEQKPVKRNFKVVPR